MSRFIPKKTLIETMAANPLDKGVKDNNDITKLTQEGILTAIAAETDAINQYQQISDMVSESEEWLKKAATPVIEDIIAEEKKHLGQLTELVSNLPGYKEDFEAGKKETETGKHVEKESVTESVNEKANEAFSKFDAEIIFDLLEKKYNVSLTDDFVMEYPLEMYADQVDSILARLNIEPNILPEIENDIINSADIEKNQITKQREEDSENLQYDIDTLKRLIEPDDSLYIRSSNIREKIYEIISDLEISNTQENI